MWIFTFVHSMQEIKDSFFQKHHFMFSTFLNKYRPIEVSRILILNELFKLIVLNISEQIKILLYRNVYAYMRVYGNLFHKFNFAPQKLAKFVKNIWHMHLEAVWRQVLFMHLYMINAKIILEHLFYLYLFRKLCGFISFWKVRFNVVTFKFKIVQFPK